MNGLSQGVELLHFGPDLDQSEWMVAQLAVDNTLAVPFSVGKPEIEHFSEIELAQFLERQARSLIERYGDARCPKPDPSFNE
jgi:hypothetical protein